MKKFIISIVKVSLMFLAVGSVLSAQGLTIETPIKGMSFLGPQDPSLDIQMFQSLQSTSSDWVALIPEAILDRETLTLKPDEENEHWGNTIESQKEAIKLAKATGLKVFLKPHIKLEDFETERSTISRKLFPGDDKTRGAYWRGDLRARTEQDWEVLESNYETYIIKLAKVAESLDVELFCIGTELREFVSRRPYFWNQLISKVRHHYSGAITYSANWDEFDEVHFWNSLDLVGVSAYFPISYSKTPSIEKTVQNWKPIKEQLRKLHESTGKKVLLTEYGYRNVSFSGAMPWVHDNGNAVPNNTAQANLYEAFYRSFWEESWIAGGFAWNWMHNELALENTDFSVRNKPAFYILKRWYINSYNHSMTLNLGSAQN